MTLIFAGLGSTATAQEPETTRPDVFRAAATANIVSATIDRDALLPIADAFRFIALEGEGTFESSNQTARASVFYPGAGGIGGPALVCGELGGQFPPEFQPVLEICSGYEYPLSVTADSLNPDASTLGSTQFGTPRDVISAAGVRAVAHAAPDSSTTTAELSALRVLGLPLTGPLELPLPIPGLPTLDASVLTIGAATTTTDQRIDENGHLTVEAISELAGLRLAGGLVEIGSVRSTTRIVDDGRGGSSQVADLEIGDVSVAGIPARITEDGLILGSSASIGGPLLQQLSSVVNDLLRDLGIRLTTLSVEKGVDEIGRSFARVGGILLEFSQEVSGLPSIPGPLGDIDLNGEYRGAVQIGASGSRGIASYVDIPEFEPSATSPPETSAVGSFVPIAPSEGGHAPESPSTSQELTAPKVPRPTEILSVGFFEDLYADRVTLVYLAFTLIALALCLGPRLSLPSRLPGGS